jgi:hypothetical protein
MTVPALREADAAIDNAEESVEAGGAGGGYGLCIGYAPPIPV